MKRDLLLLAIFMMAVLTATAQTIEFSDDFESGTDNWELTGTWGTSDLYASSGSSSLTESPAGNYGDLINISASLASGIDLSTALDAELSFQAKYDIEAGFDYMYLDASANGGTSWVNLDIFDGENDLSIAPFEIYTYSLGGFVGNSDVRIRFRFESDGAVNYDGMYIDDVEVSSSSIDNGAPLIIHSGPVYYEAGPGDVTLTAEIIDISGIESAELAYGLDGSPLASVSGTPLSGDTWLFTIPAQPAGTWVRYVISATDASSAANVASSPLKEYIAGNYIKYDEGVVSFVNSFGPASESLLNECAVRISLPGTVDLSTVLIRNYTDPDRPNDSMRVHIWADAGGIPGADLVPPITVFPEATLDNTSPMTRVDLRPYADDLAGLSGDIFVGYSVDAGQAWLVQTTPGVENRTQVYDGLAWVAITDDYHFRVITTAPLGVPTAAFSYDASGDPEVLFTDLSGNDPTAWEWDFGDGGSSDEQNPTYSYTDNGIFTVCLTASNAGGESTTCLPITINEVDFLPIAGFTFDDSASPTVSFTDQSLNEPEFWLWIFDDMGSTSDEQNPVYTFSGPGTYNVCLQAGNGAGTSPVSCQDITILPGTGIPGNSVSRLAIYPNPATEELYIEIGSDLSRDTELGLYDISGKLLMEQLPLSKVNGSKFRVNIASLHSGIYFISLFDDVTRYGGYFIKE